MAKEIRSIDITNTPDVLRLAEEVARSGVPHVLRTEREELAVVMPVAQGKKRASRSRPVTREDSLFQLVGIGTSGIEGGASERKREFLARAYRPKQ